MQNIKVTTDGDMLNLGIDLSKPVGKTANGNPKVATTDGFKSWEKLEINGRKYSAMVILIEK
jgi:hypothetical protein